MKQKMDSKNNTMYLAVLWMIGMVVSLTIMAICGRELGATMSPLQILFFRALFGLLIMTPLVLYKFGRIPVTTQFKIHLVRNVFHYLGQYAWFYAIMFIPLATVFAIDFTAPMWTVLLATLLLGEKITRWRILAIVLGIIGVLIVLRPGIETIHIASLAVLASSFCFAMTYTLTRKLAQGDSPLIILFYMSAIQLPIAILPALNTWVTPEGQAWLWIIAIGITSITAHYCLSRALAIADASIVIPMDFMRLPIIVIVGYWLYQEGLDLFVLLGASIIFAGNFLNVRHEYRSNNAVDQ
ncbi:MAG: drug/metabolite transporter (DMT)-like permease [Gammaproteobacteria bacterium]